MWTTRRFPASWLLPALLPVALMTIYPIAYALWTSLHSVLLLFPDTPFAGIDNYRPCGHERIFPRRAVQFPASSPSSQRRWWCCSAP